MKKTLALLLSLVLLCGCLSGCGVLPSLRDAVVGGLDGSDAGDDLRSRVEGMLDGLTEPAAPTQTLPRAATAGNTYFDHEIWRGDVNLSDMAYESYDAADFDAYTAAIYDIAENGDPSGKLEDADFELWDEINYVYTLYQLAEIAYNRDPADAALAEEYSRAEETYYDLNDEYWDAMGTLATSDNGHLLEELYPESYIDWFVSSAPTEDDGPEEPGTPSEESRLLQRYHSIMAESSPDYDAAAEVFVELAALRNAEAAAMGYDSYAAYCYDGYYTKDYTPEDAEAVWELAKRYFVPIVEQYGDTVTEKSGDLYFSDEVDCSPETILSAMERCLYSLSDEAYEAFRYMVDNGLYDIEPSEDKLSTGYTTCLYFYAEPFLFNCPYGTYYDYTDMFHEFGHYLNFYYYPGDLLFGMPDNDLSELQSQGMELLMMRYYEDIFGAENAGIIEADVLMNMVYSVIDGAMYDEFQQRVYAEPSLTAERTSEIFGEVCRRYGLDDSYGPDDWVEVLHNFDYPFYYISYCVSAVAALEVFAAGAESWDDAADMYFRAAALDPEAYYFSEGLAEAGFADVFTEEAFSAAAGTVAAALDAAVE